MTSFYGLVLPSQVGEGAAVQKNFFLFSRRRRKQKSFLFRWWWGDRRRGRWGKKKKDRWRRGKLPSSSWLKEPQKISYVYLPTAESVMSSMSFAANWNFPSEVRLSTAEGMGLPQGPGLGGERGQVGRGAVILG